MRIFGPDIGGKTYGMGGEERERRNKDGGPDGGCKLGPYQ